MAAKKKADTEHVTPEAVEIEQTERAVETPETAQDAPEDYESSQDTGVVQTDDPEPSGEVAHTTVTPVAVPGKSLTDMTADELEEAALRFNQRHDEHRLRQVISELARRAGT